MGGVIERLPSPAGLALWLYALAFLVLPALLAWKGFAYVLGIVIFAVGLQPHLHQLARDPRIHFRFNFRGEVRETVFQPTVKSEAWVVRIASWLMLALALLVLPVLIYVLQSQGQIFYARLEERLPAILAELGRLLDYAHGQLPGYVPEVEVEERAGWEGVEALISQVAGDAVKDLKAIVRTLFGSALQAAGLVLSDWLKLVIGALVAGTLLAGYQKESEMHRGIVSRGIKDDRLRANVLRFGELYQSGVSLFMIGYLEVAATLSLLYAIVMAVLPLGLGIDAILFMSVVLGILTAIPKIGGFLGMAAAFLLMLARLEPGLGWFGYELVSFGFGVDVAIRIGLMLAVAKLMGLLEAYNYTPEIVGRRLGMTKMQIIATVLIWAVGAGVFGMIWGILISLTFQAALRLADEGAARPALEEPAGGSADEASAAEAE